MPRRGALAAAVLTLAIVASPVTTAVAAPAVARTSASDPVDHARAAYEQARARVAALSAQQQRVEAVADAAEAEAQRRHDRLTETDSGLLGAVGGLLSGGPSALDLAEQAAEDAVAARRVADLVTTALAEQITATERARAAWEQAEVAQLRADAALSAAQYAEAALQRAALPRGYAAQGAEDRRNRAALHRWQGYLRDLARLAVVPPPVARLVDPAALPDGLAVLRDARNDFAPGVALAASPGRPPVTVLSAEAVRAVTEAFRRVGLGDVPGAITPTAYTCGGLVANAWATPTTEPPAEAGAQWEALRAVPAASVQVGDVVVLGSRGGGITATGVYVGRGQAIVADQATGAAGVRPVADDLLGVRRVGVPVVRHAAAPAGGPCDTTPTATVSTGGPLGLPVAPGAYHLSAGFGEGGEHWSSGQHTGLDFAAPVGTPVVAAGDGTVTVEHPSWAGNLVRVDHGGGVETLYAHLSRVDVADGQQVHAGEPVGLVGDRGNTTGPHLHLEVRLDDVPVDPALVLSVPGLTRPAYPNGELPDTALCDATPGGGQRLACDAAVAYRLLGAAYAATFGADLCITDSYRSLAGQQRAHVAKPSLTATPGTSVHGQGRAVDLCGGVERFGTPENTWLTEHGPRFGWVHPAWAAAGGSRPEPWHFEYVGAASS